MLNTSSKSFFFFLSLSFVNKEKEFSGYSPYFLLVMKHEQRKKMDVRPATCSQRADSVDDCPALT